MKCATKVVGIAIGVYNDGRCFVGTLCLQVSCQPCNVLILGVQHVTAYHLQFVSCAHIAVVGLGQQSFVDVEHGFGVGVEHVEQVFWRTMVNRKVVNIGSATLAKLVKGVEFRPHKGENGLLFVAQKHHRGVFFER